MATGGADIVLNVPLSPHVCWGRTCQRSLLENLIFFSPSTQFLLVCGFSLNSFF